MPRSNQVSLNGTLDSCNVGVEDILLNSVNVYPNPSADQVTVIFSDNIRRIELLDIMGRVLNVYDLNKRKLLM